MKDDEAPVGVLDALRATPTTVRYLLGGVLVNQLGAFVQTFLVLYLTHRGMSGGTAGLALGMSRTEVFILIILPQAVMRVLPALASTWVSLFKDTSLVSIISVTDLSYMALKVRSETYRILEVLTAMAVLYWLMGYPQAKIVDWIHRRWKVIE